MNEYIKMRKSVYVAIVNVLRKNSEVLASTRDSRKLKIERIEYLEKELKTLRSNV